MQSATPLFLDYKITYVQISGLNRMSIEILFQPLNYYGSCANKKSPNPVYNPKRGKGGIVQTMRYISYLLKLNSTP